MRTSASSAVLRKVGASNAMRRSLRRRTHRVGPIGAVVALASSVLAVVTGMVITAGPAAAAPSTATTTVASWTSLSCGGWGTFTVPANVTQVDFTLWGGGGAAGDNYTYINTAAGGAGGQGARVSGTIAGAAPGTTISARIGCGGTDASNASADGFIDGGPSPSAAGGGGGAASALCLGDGACSNVLAIAAGGGGGGIGQTNLVGGTKNGGRGGNAGIGTSGARNAGTANAGETGANGGDASSPYGIGGAGSSVNLPPDTTSAPSTSPGYGAGGSGTSRGWCCGGGGGGGLLGGGGGEGGRNNDSLGGYRAAGGGGAGSSWIASSPVFSGGPSVSGGSFAASGATNADCTTSSRNTSVTGVNPGYGGTPGLPGCAGYVTLTLTGTSTTAFDAVPATATSGVQFGTQPVVSAKLGSVAVSPEGITLKYQGTRSNGTTVSSTPLPGCTGSVSTSGSTGQASFGGCYIPDPGTYTLTATNAVSGLSVTSGAVTVSANQGSWSTTAVNVSGCTKGSFTLPSTSQSADVVVRGGGGGGGGGGWDGGSVGGAGGAGGQTSLTNFSIPRAAGAAGALTYAAVNYQGGCKGAGGPSNGGTANTAGGAGGGGWGAGGTGGTATVSSSRNTLGGGGGGGAVACFGAAGADCGSAQLPLVVAGGGGGGGAAGRGTSRSPGLTGGGGNAGASSSTEAWYGTGVSGTGYGGAGGQRGDAAGGGGGGGGDGTDGAVSFSYSTCTGGAGGVENDGGKGGNGRDSSGSCGSPPGSYGLLGGSGSGSSSTGGNGGAGANATWSGRSTANSGGGGGGGYYGGGGGGADGGNSGANPDAGGGGGGSSWVYAGTSPNIGGSASANGTGGGSAGAGGAQNTGGGNGGDGGVTLTVRGVAILMTNPGNQAGNTATSVNLGLTATASQIAACSPTCTFSASTVSGQTLPPGLSVSGSAVVGTPTTPGTYPVTLYAATTGSETGIAGGHYWTSVSFTWTVTAAATKLAVTTQPTDKLNGSALAVAVSVLDPFNNVATTASNPVTLSIASGTGGTLSGTCTANPSAGIASFGSCVINVAAVNLGTSFTLTATSPGLTSAPPSTSFTVWGPVSTTRTQVTNCSSSPVPGTAVLCRVIVTDVGVSGRTTPTGTATLSNAASTGTSARFIFNPGTAQPTTSTGPATCTLQVLTAGSSASCDVVILFQAANTNTLTAEYNPADSHASGTGSFNVSPTGSTWSVYSPALTSSSSAQGNGPTANGYIDVFVSNCPANYHWGWFFDPVDSSFTEGDYGIFDVGVADNDGSARTLNLPIRLAQGLTMVWGKAFCASQTPTSVTDASIVNITPSPATFTLLPGTFLRADGTASAQSDSAPMRVTVDPEGVPTIDRDGIRGPEVAALKARVDAALPAMAPVVRTFLAATGRPPTHAELAFWSGSRRSGLDAERMAAVLASSSHFRSRYGAMDDGQFVAALYAELLGRPPDAGTLSGSVALLAGGASRASVLAAIAGSAEYGSRTASLVYGLVTNQVLSHRSIDLDVALRYAAFLDSAIFKVTMIEALALDLAPAQAWMDAIGAGSAPMFG